MPFKKGSQVRLKAPVIEGPVAAVRYDDDRDTFVYMIEYTGADGDPACREFDEADLEQVETAPAPSETPVTDPAPAEGE